MNIDLTTQEGLQQIVTIVGQLATLLAVSGAIGIVLNPIISYLKTFFGLNQEGKKVLKLLIAFLTSVVGGIAGVYYLGYFLFASVVNIIVTILLVFLGSYLFYKTYWSDSELIKKIEGSY